MCLKERFLTHKFVWKLLKEYLSGFEKSTIFQEVSAGFLVKNDQILKSAFYTRLCPSGSPGVESCLSAINALSKNFLFKIYLNFIFCRLFLCHWSVERAKKCLRGHFRPH